MSTKPLTRKQQAFVTELIDNPKQSATQAALTVYGKPDKPTTYQTAGQIATDNLKNPQIIMALADHNKLVESTLIGTVSDWGRSDNSRRREIAQNAAMFIHDKVHGKAKQTVDVNTQSVVITIDLSQAALDNSNHGDSDTE